MNKKFTVQGTQMVHEVEIWDVLKFPNTNEMMVYYRASDFYKNKCQCWAPENGARFKSVGAATGWLKKLLKKWGWPEPTRWAIVQWQPGDGIPSIEIYLLRPTPK